MKRSQPSSDQTSTSRNKTQKKTRFVPPEDDPARFEENVEAQLEESKNQKRQGRVKTDGYDSDSSDDGEGVVRSRWKGTNAGNVEDEDEDMFAMGDKEEKDEEVAGTNKKKKAEFLRLGDIEGQEFNDGSAGGSGKEEDTETSEDEPEDEDEAERRKKAGMGYEVSSFNMREEMEEGKFTEDGTFVRSFDPHAIHDRWLEESDERAIKKARRAKRALERKEREKLRAEEREAQQAESKEDMEKEMLTILKKGETVLEALARLGESARKAKGKEKQNAKGIKKSRTQTSAMDVDDNKAHPSAVLTTAKQTLQKSKIEELTTLASNLLSLGDVDIYNKTYEHLLRSVRSSGNVEPDWAPPPQMFEYKWDVPGATVAQNGTDGEAQVFGPFSEDEMKAWMGANYFGESGEKVKVRLAGGEWGNWDDVVD